MSDAESNWSELLRDSRDLLELNRHRKAALDVERRRNEGGLLGASIGLESDAIQLALVGLEVEAIEYFGCIREMALEAAATPHEELFRDVSGRRHFARSVAYRVARLCEWFLGGPHSNALLDAAVEQLNAAMAEEPASVGEGPVVARALLHWCQLRRWPQALTLAPAQLSGTPGTWPGLIEGLRSLALSGGVEGKALCVWLEKHVSWGPVAARSVHW